jgi:hypothetical protein
MRLFIDKKQTNKRRVLTEEKLDAIGARPRKSLKRLAQETWVSKSSARTATQLLKPSSERLCLVCCKCKDCCTCVLNEIIIFEKYLRIERTAFSTPPVICELLTTSFGTLSVVRHAASSAKFVCASQQAAHGPPWSAKLWIRSTH